MLVTFRSKAGASITMFGEHAQRMLKLMGASGTVPGAFNAEDVPAALGRLQAGLQAQAEAATAAPPAALNEARAEQDDEERRAATVSLATRAAPLVDLLQRAAAAKAALIWEKVG